MVAFERNFGAPPVLEIVAAPKEASVARMMGVPGTSVVPNSTAVPSGEALESCAAGQPPLMGA